MSIIAVSSLVLVAYEPYFVVFILSLLCHLYRVLAHLYDEETVGGQRDAEVVAGRAVGKELAAIGGEYGYSFGSGVHNAQDAVFNPCAGTVVGNGLAEACGLGVKSAPSLPVARSMASGSSYVPLTKWSKFSVSMGVTL